MFDSIVSILVTSRPLPAFNALQYDFSKALRRAAPEAFTKAARQVTFIGTQADLLARKDELIEIMRQQGYTMPTATATRVPSADRQAERIAEIESLSDEELFARIEDTFNSLTLLSEAASHLKIRSMIVSGSPGTGKTYEVIKAMKSRSKENRNFYYHQVKGTISPIALYIELYRARNGVLILDDADEAFMDNESLQLLKAATESTKERNVSYRKLSMALEAEGIPQEFVFEGCVIILTNTNLEEARKQRQSHYDAIMSRAHYINAVLATDREKIMRIRHIITTTPMLKLFPGSAVSPGRDRLHRRPPQPFPRAVDPYGC